MRDQVRGIAARGQAAGTKREEATVIRFYDNAGAVKKEYVFRDGVKYRRESTLPQDFAVRPLSDFLSPTAGHALLSTTAPVLSDVTWDDTTTNGIVTIHDSIWTNLYGIADFVQEATDPTRTMFGDFWFNGTSTDSLLDATGMTVYFPVDTFGVMGVEVFGQDLEDIKSTYLAYIPASLQSRDTRIEMTSRTTDRRIARVSSESTSTTMSATANSHVRMMQEEWPEEGPCDLELYNAQFWSTAAVFTAGRTAVACKGLRKFTSGCVIHKGLTSFLGAAASVAVAEYALCLDFYGGGVALRSNSDNAEE